MIEVHQVTKVFTCRRPLREQLLRPLRRGNAIRALDHVTFRVEPGEIVGVVGPNGAGKTTLMRIIADLITPDQGSVRICGQEMNNNRILRRRVGFISSDDRSFFWRLTGRQNLCFFSQLYGVSSADFHQRCTALAGALGVSSKAHELFRDLSTGTRKKFSLIRALLHQPQVVLLDEMTSSLDPEATQMAKSIVKNYVSEQKDAAVLWSTHRLEEIGEICHKVLVLKNGQVELFDSLHQTPSGPNPRPLYRLQIRNLNGRLQTFSNHCASIAKFKCLTMQNLHEFVFENITADDFGGIVAVAVEKFNAQVLFAGMLA